MTTRDDEPVYPPKLQPALANPLARLRRETRWILSRSWRVLKSEGAFSVFFGAGRWAERMTLRSCGMRRLALRMWLAGDLRRGDVLVGFVDMDGLSRVDLALGRNAAKRVVANAGRQLRLALGDGALIFRYGGDEYVCAISDAAVTECAAKLVAARKAMLQTTGRTFTAGITKVRPGDTAYTAVKRAELHMFSAKETPGVAISTGLTPATERQASESVMA